ncbi:MAG TPA: TssQ family T6SS-associated lipoprotein [Burkholderiales bacterium]|nr:TssQ family T6SS-associated lipoprotein [Burkholderiales bacterium]
MKRTALLLAALLLAGCESAPIREIRGLFQPHKGEPELAAGIRSYEDGRYAESARQLQSALDAGLGRTDQVRAHKYLAFIHCSSGRERACREEFRKALDLDPGFELAPAEAGHPVWGPVFRSEKARRRP